MFRYVLNNPYELNTKNLTSHTIESPSVIEYLNLSHKLPLHNGCVNTIEWDNSGQFLLTGSDDRRIIISNPFSKKVTWNKLTSHRSNIFSARFLPHQGGYKVVSCAGDGSVIVTDLDAENSDSENVFSCHSGAVYDVVSIESEPHTFFSVGEDGSVRWFDLRAKSKCTDRHCREDILFRYHTSCASLAVNPLLPYQMAVGTGDSHVYVMDRRKMSSCGSGSSASGSVVSQLFVPELGTRNCQVTSVKFSPDGYSLLASYSGEAVYLFSLNECGEYVALNDIADSFVQESDGDAGNSQQRSRQLPNFRRIRLRGDWSDTGPSAGVDRTPVHSEIGQARPTVQANLMQRMADVLSTMLQRNFQRGPPSSALPSTAMEVEAQSPSLPPNPDGPTASSEVIDCVTYESLGAAEPAVDNAAEDSPSLSNNNEDPHVAFPFESPRTSVSSGIHLNELEESIMADCLESSSSPLLGSDSVFRVSPKAKYTGHRNARTIINEASFWGSSYIMSGSDCGHVFVWDRHRGNVVKILEADSRVVNRVRPHPHFPILATSGIDYDVKIWMPSAQPHIAPIDVNELMERNARMLEATRDTVVVPATFMIRMLATLSHLRRSGSRLNSESEPSAET